ncbi:hypothetical protein COO60DRAFT_1626145 [Scenedesmus sp. NREL 46B-D3]|nr:hypothetical protein COO60DRAFT_1626145 [Scenedesmus sp. NREL 46B-D3]
MSKRRATDELYGDSAKRTDQTGRGSEFTAHLRGLNSQFAQWVQQQAAQAGDQLWLAGVKDYVKHADKLLEQYDDVLVNGNQHRSSSPLASNLFGTPAPAANGPAAADAGGATGRSTGFGAGGGRKSVTFAEQPSATTVSAAAATPGFGAAASAATPGTANTANAGHTPAPASGLGFSFGATPGATPAAPKGAELPSPEPFKLGGSATPSSAGGAAGISPGPSPSTSGFKFGTPAADAGAADAAAGGAGGDSSAPAFGFATGAAAGSGAAGAGLFNFPAPSAAQAAPTEAAPKFKPELKVDEAVWNVLFSSKARLHVRVKKGGAPNDWEGRGIGMLTVRQPKQGDSNKTYIMFSTDVGKQLVSSQLMSNSAVSPIPNQPKKCRMSLMVLQYDLPPAGKEGGGAAAAADKPRHLPASFAAAARRCILWNVQRHVRHPGVFP